MAGVEAPWELMGSSLERKGKGERGTPGGRTAGGLALCSFLCAVRGCSLRERRQQGGRRKERKKEKEGKEENGKFSKLQIF
jgi:hypothetical protein